MNSRLPICLSAIILAALPHSFGARFERAGAALRRPTAAPAETLVPEAERSLQRLILGLQANETRLLMLPETAAWDPHTRDPRVHWLRAQLYRISLELAHGQIFRHAPADTRFFIAVPDPREDPGSLGDEEEVLREHLRERAGWTDAEIARRVRFFMVPTPVLFPQDMAEPIAYDEEGRLVLGVGSDTDEPYQRAVESLVRTYPSEFVRRELPGVNTEGGDLALVRLPDDGIGLMVGHNRIERWIRHNRPGRDANRSFLDADVEAARLAYQRAFGVGEVIVIGREALHDPSLANPEIFHVDMVAAVLRTPAGIVAFVPTYQGSPVDALTHVHLDPAAVARFQAEYDRAAHQLAGRGYRVARVPFADHPARNPVGIGKFVEASTGRAAVLLGRYPDHLQAADDRNAQTRLQFVLQDLDAAVAAWRRDPSDTRWRDVRAEVAATWRQMGEAVAAPNPIFDAQKRVYESYGVRVDALPIFATGEGGVHCLVLK